MKKQLFTRNLDPNRRHEIGRDYKVFLTSIIIVTFVIISGLLLFGALDAKQIETARCEPDWIKSDCFPRGERPICPSFGNDGCDGKDTPKPKPNVDRFRERIPQIQFPDCSMLPCPLDAAR